MKVKDANLKSNKGPGTFEGYSGGNKVVEWSKVYASINTYRAVRQVIGRDCSLKFLDPSIHIVVGNFC